MPITKLEMQNVTVFDKISVDFCSGINILVGENGFGKTHIMKILYAACQSAKPEVDFPHKTVMVFRPENSAIRRLVNRDKAGGNTAKVKVYSDIANIGMTFTSKTQKWKAETTGVANWERQMNSLSSVFIPAKEILSNAWNLEAAVKMNNVEFDDTYLDIIAAAKIDISRGKDSAERRKYLELLNKINNGKVTVSEDRFYLKPGTQARLEFNLVAEGIRKIALLWQLIKNGTLENGSVLFWDEPEANINPKHIPVIADMLLLLQREGVQIFVSTHDYFLTKYLDLLRTEKDIIKYHSLYRNEGSVSIQIEQKEVFKELENNSILDTFMSLYREEIREGDGVMEEIVESGMNFGPFQEWEIFRIEKSKLLQKFNSGKTVEFVYRKKKNMLYFVEAKSSSAIIQKGNEEKYEKFLSEIICKFEDSFNLLLTALIERRDDYGEISEAIKKTDYKITKFRFFLIIKGHELTWLPPLQLELEKRLKHFLKIWDSEVFVLNDTLALEHGLIEHLSK